MSAAAFRNSGKQFIAMAAVLVLLLSLWGMALSSSGAGQHNDAFGAGEQVVGSAMPMRQRTTAPMMSKMAAGAAPEMMMADASASTPMSMPAPAMMRGGGGAEAGSFSSFAAQSMPADGAVDTSFAPLYGQTVLVKEAHVSAETKELDKAVSLVLKLIAGINGQVEHSNVNHAQSPSSGDEDSNPYQWRPPSTADIRAKVPAKALDSFLEQLRAALITTPLGDSQSVATILSENQNARDASAEYVDAATRERVEMASLETMKQLLERATSVTEVLEVRREMMAITQRIEGARAQSNDLEKRAAMSYVSINLQTPQWKPPKPKPFPSWSVSGSAAKAVKQLMLVAQLTADLVIFAAVFALPTLVGLVVAFYVLRLALSFVPFGKLLESLRRVQAAVVADGAAPSASGGSAAAASASRRTE